MKRHSPLQLVLWLGVALLAHFLVALFGVLNRWLQVGAAGVHRRRQQEHQAGCWALGMPGHS